MPSSVKVPSSRVLADALPSGLGRDGSLERSITWTRAPGTPSPVAAAITTPSIVPPAGRSITTPSRCSPAATVIDPDWPRVRPVAVAWRTYVPSPTSTWKSRPAGHPEVRGVFHQRFEAFSEGDDRRFVKASVPFERTRPEILATGFSVTVRSLPGAVAWTRFRANPAFETSTSVGPEPRPFRSKRPSASVRACAGFTAMATPSMPFPASSTTRPDSVSPAPSTTSIPSRAAPSLTSTPSWAPAMRPFTRARMP
jgi:hypothetical protein